MSKSLAWIAVGFLANISANTSAYQPTIMAHKAAAAILIGSGICFAVLELFGNNDSKK